MIVAGALVVVLVSGFGTAVASDPGRGARSHPVSRISLGKCEINGPAAVIGCPKAGSVAVGEGTVWVTDSDKNIYGVDPSKRKITATIPFSGQDIAVTRGAIWVTLNNTVTRIDPVSRQVVATITLAPIPPGFTSAPLPSRVAGGQGAIWATNSLKDGVSRIDPATNEVVATIPVGATPVGVAVGSGAVWISATVPTAPGPGHSMGQLVRVDPATNDVTATIPIGGRRGAGVAVGGGAVWVLNGDKTVSRINPHSNEVSATLDLGSDHPEGIAVGEGAGMGH